MSRRGRKPTPTALFELHGRPNKGRARKGAEPQPKRPLEFEPPAHLDAEGAAEWRRIRGDLAAIKMLTTVDRAALAAYCACWSRWVKAERRLQETSELLRTTNGNIVQSPWVGIANRSMELMHRYLSEFGMTPASRVRLASPTPDPVPPSPGENGTEFRDDLDTFLDQHPDRRLN